jgi:hypothetical protein
MNLEGSLPPGLAGEAEYHMGDHRAEGTNLAKELFGFHRARAISGQ